jgi:HD superfamily phosphodiesterase
MNPTLAIITMSLLNKLFHFVLLISNKFNIDESHGLSHSMNVLHFAHNILEWEKKNYPYLEDQSKIIYVSAAIHDMCDKKYMNENEGIRKINEFLEDKLDKKEIDIVTQIISTMSYSTVKKNGFPELYEYQMAYHIVREADLLAAYDFDRCIMYNIHKQIHSGKNEELKFSDAFNDANELFQKRVLKHHSDGLFITKYSQENYLPLQINTIKRIQTWKNIIKKPLI